MQMLEELARKYEETRSTTINDLKLQRLYVLLPKSIEQQLALEVGDGSAAYESVIRKANTWIMLNSTERADMDLDTMGNWREHENKDGGEELDTSGSLMGMKGGKRSARKVQYNGYGHQCGRWGHTAKNYESTATVCNDCGQWGHMVRSCPEKEEGKQGKGETQGDHTGKGNGKTGKGWRRNQKGKKR